MPRGVPGRPPSRLGRVRRQQIAAPVGRQARVRPRGKLGPLRRRGSLDGGGVEAPAPRCRGRRHRCRWRRERVCKKERSTQITAMSPHSDTVSLTYNKGRRRSLKRCATVPKGQKAASPPGLIRPKVPPGLIRPLLLLPEACRSAWNPTGNRSEPEISIVASAAAVAEEMCVCVCVCVCVRVRVRVPVCVCACPILNEHQSACQRSKKQRSENQTHWSLCPSVGPEVKGRSVDRLLPGRP